MAYAFEDLAPHVLEVPVSGPQGPAGPQGAQGPAGPSGGAALSVVADSSIGGHRVVVLKASGAPEYADNTNSSHTNKVLGITLNAGNSGDTISVVRSGEVVEPTWNWTLDLPVFLGTNGLLTQSAPANPAVFSQVVGFPVDATTLFVTLREPLLLI